MIHILMFIGLSILALSFQNCGEPLDPALLADSTELPSEVANDSSDPLDVSQKLSFKISVFPKLIKPTDSVQVITDVSGAKGLITYEVRKNGALYSSLKEFSLDSVLRSDRYTITVKDNEGEVSQFVPFEFAEKEEPIFYNQQIVEVFTECNFTGKSVKLKVGDYLQKQLLNFGVDNAISSIRVHNNMLIHFFSSDSYGGSKGELAGTNSCLPNRWLNIISSVKVVSTNN